MKLELVKRYKDFSNAFATANSAVVMYKSLRDKYNEKFLYTATLDENAFVYGEVMAHINAKTNSRNFKFLSDRNGIFKYYDSSSVSVFYIGEHKIKVELNKESKAAPDDYGIRAISSLHSKDELNFTASSAEGLQALEKLMMEMTEKKQLKSKNIYLANVTSWGEWEHENLPHKTLDSVYLPHGVKEDLILDIEKFLESEKKFVNVGIPWHRGYAFYGKPGNGKSSVALALANHFSKDLYNLPLSAIKDDKSLVKSISDLNAGSILLLEDIDVFSNTMSREQSKSSPTLAGLLNALDGVGTPHGLITIMTTNHFNKLDPALVRPGRMDYKLHLKAPVQSQIEEMFSRVFEEPLGVETRKFKSMAEVTDVFKRNIEDAESARLEIKGSSDE